MWNRFWCPWMVLGLLACLCGGRALRAQELPPDAGTRLLLHFNNGATGSAGETPVLESGLEYTTGTFGTGASFASDDRLRYSAEGNIAATAGTVETWIKPDWNGNDGQNHVILNWGGGGGILVGKDGAGNLRIILNRYGAGGQPEQGVAFNINSWVGGQWHHVAFTWTAATLRLYIDGTQRAQNPVSITLPEISEAEFEIGGDGGGSSVAATLDELRISDFARSAEDVKMAFASAGYSNAELPGDVDTQLLLHFNNHTTGLAGEMPTTSMGVSFSTGRHSEGASLSTGDRLIYSATGNITAASGTVEGWFRPEWSGNDAQNHLVLTWGALGGLLIGKDAADNLRLMLNRYSAGGLPEQGTAINIGDWPADQWRHLAFSWDAEWMRIYIDGQLAAEAPVTITLPAIGAGNVQIGGEGTGSSLGAVVDEFRISRVARTAAEIAQTFMGGLQVSSLSATPDTLILQPTGTATPSLTAQTDLGDFEIPARAAAWSSSNPAVASVTQEGLVTALAGGTATVSASYREFTAVVDVTVSQSCELANPEHVRATALNEAVRLRWTPVDLPPECFGQYRVYRESSPFTNVAELTPVAELTDVLAGGWLDEGLPNDQPFWYAVVSVDPQGVFDPEVTPVGPRTPHWLSDLQVACMRRDPQFPRYAPVYSTYEITEPGGFGPYLVSAATGLDQGQSCEDPHQPGVGDPVTWTAVVRNSGTTTWEGDLPWIWWVDFDLQEEGQRWVSLAPGDTALFTHTRLWDEDGHTLQFSIYSWDDRSGNNDLAQDAWSVPFKTYVDETQLEQFRELSGTWPSPWTTDHIDWLQRHMQRFNELFEQADVPKRVHYDLLQVLDDPAPDPLQPPDNLFGIFPFRYRAGEGDPRLSGYYVPDEDLDYGLLHELAHQLGLIDIYQLDVPAAANQVSGLPYAAHEDLMNACSPLINQHSAAGMRRWDRQGHGYYGQYLYGIPATLRLRFLDYQGNPLTGAQVEVFQYCERPGQGKVISDQVKFEGATDGDGVYTLPNVDIDESLVPATCLGDELHDNPFGYVAVVATNGVFHIRVTHGGETDYAWLDISEVNMAYYDGATEEATFERQLMLGGEPDYFLEADVTEGNAGDWAIATNGDNSLVNDGETLHQGADALRAETAGDFLTLIYPGNRMGRYDLSGCDSLVFWTRVSNDYPFQMNAPQIRLYCPGGTHLQFLPDHDLLSEAWDQWRRVAVPLAGGEGWERSEWGEPDLSQVNSIEFFADTWDWGFSWWLDGLHVTPACCATDCNGNGIRDCDDIASGFSQDGNGNQVPDECECSGEIPAPGLRVALDGADLLLDWDPVTHDPGGCPLGAVAYRVWQAAEAGGPWSVVADVAESELRLPLAGTRGFFRVTATDEDEIPAAVPSARPHTR
jgi:hypothetical protein